MPAAKKEAPPYELGHTDVELERLARQAKMLESITRRFFVEAGLALGMRVLDVGSGAGDVAFLAADIVGPTGEVLGTDIVPGALARANARRVEMGLRNVSFQECDPTETTFDRPFDAVIGRYVLQWQGDPVAMLRGLAPHVRSGGAVVFHELDWKGVRSVPPCPSYDDACHWMEQALTRSGIEAYMGIKMHRTYMEAGLPPPTLRVETQAGGPRDPSGVVSDIAHTYLPVSMIPVFERLGIATSAEVETYPDRVLAEIEANGSVILGRWEVGAWSRLP